MEETYVFNFWTRMKCHLTEARAKDTIHWVYKTLKCSGLLSGKRANRKKMQRIYVEIVVYVNVYVHTAYVCMSVYVYVCSFFHIPIYLNTGAGYDFNSNVWFIFMHVCKCLRAYVYHKENDDHHDEGEIKSIHFFRFQRSWWQNCSGGSQSNILSERE